MNDQDSLALTVVFKRQEIRPTLATPPMTERGYKSGSAADGTKPTYGNTSGKSGTGPKYETENGLFVGPWYYTARYLHRRPSPLKPIKPEYPESAGEISGTITIRLFINTEGAVDDYKIEEAKPAGVFEKSVIDAFTNIRYAPGQIAGQAVKSQMLVEVTFDPGLPPKPNFQLIDGAANQGSTSSLGKGN